MVEEKFLKAFCARTRIARKARELTEAEMAAALGVGYEAYRKYKSRTPLSHCLIERFARITGVEIEWLITGRDNSKPRPRLTQRDIDHAIEALGGNKAVAEVCGVSSSAVSNWRAHGFFPPRLFISLSQAAKSNGVTLSQKLFRENTDYQRSIALNGAAH